jgi:cap2 methyltransferase
MPSTHRFTPYPVNKPDHPHCMQAMPWVFASKYHDILLHEQFPREKYVARDKSSPISIMHRGQRKLLMSEIGALVLLDPAVQYVAVYAGAAPGIHTPLLSELFPNVTFHLYDPAPFMIKETEKIKLFNACFTDETAQAYTAASHKNLVFICDIRRTNNEQMVWEDMQAQRRWHEIMQPTLTSLKFRLPWPGNGVASESNQVEYLDGDIHLPVWGPHNTTESRLVIQQGLHKASRMYDCLAYEEEMCFFNRVTRPSVHKWQARRNDGLDGCYDCTAELALLEKYAKIWTHKKLSTGLISRELRRDIRAPAQEARKQGVGRQA